MNIYIYKLVNARGETITSEKTIPCNISDVNRLDELDELDYDVIDHLKSNFNDIKDQYSCIISLEECVVGIYFYENEINKLTRCKLQRDSLKEFFIY